MRSQPQPSVICLLLLAGTLAVFQDLPRHEFVNFDDIQYITQNPHVLSGLTVENVKWALGTGYAGNWHPLTWLSHMLDIQIFGPVPGMHHLVSLLIHMVNSALLFLVFRDMTGALWRSAFVAALFAVHPLHVESVAWVSERKDVLSTFFWILAVWAYVAYSQKPTGRRYALVGIFWILGLLCKPMPVTLPFVLLLLDYWPLGRFHLNCPGAVTQEGSRKWMNAHPVIEKIPLFLLAAAWSVLTYWVQKRSGLILNLDVMPFGLRMSNALISYLGYIGKTLWPGGLAAYYVHPDVVSLRHAAGAGICLACISFILLRAAAKHPYLAVGWLWYLGTLVPVIGLVHVGGQSMADRYTYIPIVGLFMMLTWGVPALLGEGGKRRVALAFAGCVVLSACGLLAWAQVRHWKDSLSLWNHAIRVTDRNYVAHNMLGGALALQGRFEEAMSQFSESLRIRPGYEKAHHYMGLALMEKGRTKEAESHFHQALAGNCDFPDVVCHMLGVVALQQGNPEKAEEHLRTALRLNPLHVGARVDLGDALEKQGREEEAISLYLGALEIDPANALSRFRMARILSNRGKIREAVAHYEKALESNPGLAEAHYNMGVMLDQIGRLREASDSFSTAVRLRPDFVEARNNLAVSLARQGKCHEAIPHLHVVLRLQPDHEPARRNLDLCLRSLEKPAGDGAR